MRATMPKGIIKQADAAEMVPEGGANLYIKA
jgi:hypothetical protein